MKSYQINIIVDHHFGESIRNLPADEPAWIIDSKDNHFIIQKILKERKLINRQDGITSFKHDINETPEESFLKIYNTIDLHHGKYSHNPPYSIINVIGIDWSEQIGKELSNYGIIFYKNTSNGFIAKRKIDI